MDMTLAELQEMAARQQQQIEAQQQLLASKVHKEVQNERERRQGLVERWVDTRDKGIILSVGDESKTNRRKDNIMKWV